MLSAQRSTVEFDLPVTFTADCSDAFYDELFRLIPAARSMFRSATHMKRMFSIALSLMLKEANNPEHLKLQLRHLGERHRNLGILPLHIKIGRQAFLNAVGRAAPKISGSERKFFEHAYDEITKEMIGRA